MYIIYIYIYIIYIYYQDPPVNLGNSRLLKPPRMEETPGLDWCRGADDDLVYNSSPVSKDSIMRTIKIYASQTKTHQKKTTTWKTIDCFRQLWLADCRGFPSWWKPASQRLLANWKLKISKYANQNWGPGRRKKRRPNGTTSGANDIMIII